MEGQGKFELRLRINDADLHHTVFFFWLAMTMIWKKKPIRDDNHFFIIKIEFCLV